MEMYFEAIDGIVRTDILPDRTPSTWYPGTICVPTFNFAFARGEDYDPVNQPSDGMGIFSEYIRKLPDTLRTPHPMQSLAVIGYYAQDIAGRNTLSAFDPGSAFERLLELDFDLLLLGADIQAVSMVHYCEQKAKVPYRYWKDFSGRVKTMSGWEIQTYRMFVRDEKINPILDLHPIQVELESRGQWNSIPISYGTISTCKLAHFVAVTDELLDSNPWVLIKQTINQTSTDRTRNQDTLSDINKLHG